MTRPTRISGGCLAAALLAGTFAAAPPASRAAAPAGKPRAAVALSPVSLSTLPRLRGYVADPHTIGISDHRVPRGRYRIVVRDTSTHHDWHLTGPYVDRTTTIAGTGRWAWTVRLRKGTYKIVCDAHSSTMYTYLRVTG